jgi:hypothetical protein
VLARLRAAFVASPGLAVYSRSPTHFERIAGPDDGAMLLAAVTTGLDRSDYVALLERTRAEIHGLTIGELCEGQGLASRLFLQAHARGGRESSLAPGKVELIINLKTAKALGLTVPFPLFCPASKGRVVQRLVAASQTAISVLISTSCYWFV